MAAIINERLQKYAPKTQEEETHALKEILQEIILCGLSDAGFFKEAIFQGGTSLRIFYNLARFSEDLDFILKQPNANFKWQPFIKAIEDICKQYEISPEVTDKSKAGNIQKMILKDNSIVKLLNLSLPNSSKNKLTIKLEIDINPPFGSGSQIKFLDFPLAAEVAVQDLHSNFAGKCHALFCRKYIKGRDWYDFLWYVSKEISPNFIFLEKAINQQGRWAGQNIEATPNWYLAELEKKIHRIDWQQAAKGVLPFLNEQDRKTLKLWGVPFFLDRVDKLKKTLDVLFMEGNNIDELVAFQGKINENEKALIKAFLKDLQRFFLKIGHKVDKINVERQLGGDGDGIIYTFLKNKEKPYKVHIGRAIFIDQKLEASLREASNAENFKTLLDTQAIRVGKKETFLSYP